MLSPSEAAERAIRMVRECKELSYDTEGTGLDWKRNAPIGYVVGELCTSGGPVVPECVYVPVRHGGGGNLLGGRPMTKPDDEWEPHAFERELAAAFDHRNRLGLGRTVGHHIKFDCHFSANAGVMLGRNLADTQNIEALLDEYAPSYSLEECAKRRGVTAKRGEAMYAHISRTFGVPNNRDAMGHFWRLPGNDPVAVDYAVGDGITTGELYVAQMAQIEEEELSVVERLESELIWTLFRMERMGMRVDETRIDTLRRETEAEVDRLIREIGVGFNSRSPKMVREYMEKEGHTDWPTTAKGNPSFTEKWLKTHDAGKRILAMRQAANLINTFIGPLRERHMFKGRVHATLNQLKMDDKGTISGRFSCSDPNLQQVPKHKKHLAIPFRRLFVVDKGQLFWERDWSQCEPRLFAHYSGDENLTTGYLATPFVDAHQTVANLLSVERDPTAKRMNMGIFTGMGKPTFAGHMGWDLEKASEAHDAWYRAFPAIRGFQNKAKKRLRNRGYVMTLLGRRGRLENPRLAYKATSKIIQGSNADIAKWKLLEMDRFCEANGDLIRVQMTVHDSFNGQTEDSPRGRKLLAELDRIMEDVRGEPFNLSVPFVAEGTEGYDWAEATFGDKL